MSKELRALERVKTFMSKNAVHWKQDIEMIETALKRLEESEIDVGTWKEIAEHKQKEFNIIHEECVRLTKIKNKQDEILRIIKEKRVNVGLLFASILLNYTEYLEALDNNWTIVKQISKEPLTQEEFNLLKEVLL